MIKKVAIKVKDHISKILSEIDLSTLSAVVMVGGFSNSSIILNEMKKLVSDKVPLIVPESADLCIVKGAVIFGFTDWVVITNSLKGTMMTKEVLLIRMGSVVEIVSINPPQ